MGKESRKKIVEIGSSILGGIVSSSFDEIVIPGSTLLGAVIGPVVTEVTEDIALRMLSHAENDRLQFVSKQLIAKIQRRLDAGECPRRDDDFYVRDEYGQSSASKLLEEVLLKAKQEFEAKKLEFYSNFWSNVCFENGITYETANSLIGQFSALSYQQIKILVYLDNGYTIPLGKWEKYMFSSSTLAPYYTLYSDCLHLFNYRLAAQHSSKSEEIQLGTPDVCISPSGKLMCRLLELGFRQEEYEDSVSLIHNIDEIVDRLMMESNDDGSDRVLSHIPAEDIDQLFKK